MRRVIANVFLSLDGVMQAPGGTTEDPTGGFAHGGWLPAHADDELGARIEALFTEPFDLLLGRRTFEIFAAYWPFVNGPDDGIGAKFDRARKYVLTGSDRALDWQDSHRLASLDDLAALKQGDGPDLIIQGSSTLYPQLLRAGLLDRLSLMIFPVLLGSGKRLFGDGTPGRTMRMVEHQVTERGNIYATYEPAGSVETGSFLTIEPSVAELVRRERMADGTW